MSINIEHERQSEYLSCEACTEKTRSAYQSATQWKVAAYLGVVIHDRVNNDSCPDQSVSFKYLELTGAMGYKPEHHIIPKHNVPIRGSKVPAPSWEVYTGSFRYAASRTPEVLGKPHTRASVRNPAAN